ncbi:hypothetical protein CLA01_38440 [Chryseobacterium lathyri]|uniref:Uncharacterized protein n=1 Tax=Chryseobacterium lathyri TaxID=395933 RepID=A0A511YEZ9_9FLAO|nr:hypothetical protein CLA01_38440 [Chryseobacterium lathyri]
MLRADEALAERSHVDTDPAVIFILFKPLMCWISKIPRKSLFTEHGDNENTKISIMMSAL